MSTAIRLDAGEDEGRALVAALPLSLATGKAFVLQGLKRPLGSALASCVRAAQAVSGARVDGLQGEGASELVFDPGPVRPGHYLLDAGPNGCVAHLVQLLVVPLGLAGAASTLKLTGVTHGEGAPPVPWLSWVWLPLLREIGHEAGLGLDAAGFAPEAGGEVTVEVRPAGPARALDRRSRGTLREARVLSTVSNLAFDAACRQSERALHRLKEAGVYAEAENLPVRAPRSRGVCCLVLGNFERGRAGFWAMAPGESAVAGGRESLASQAASAFVGFLRSRAAVDEALAEKLIVPLSLAAAGLQGGTPAVSRLCVAGAGERLLSTAAIAERFLEVEIAVLAAPDGPEADLRIAPREAGLVAALKRNR